LKTTLLQVSFKWCREQVGFEQILDPISQTKPESETKHGSSVRIQTCPLFRYYSQIHIAVFSIFRRHFRWESVVTYHIIIWIILSCPLLSDLCLDGLSDGQFTSSLTNLSQIGSRETMSYLGQVFQVDILYTDTKQNM